MNADGLNDQDWHHRLVMIVDAAQFRI